MSRATPWYRVLYAQVLVAVVLGVLLGWQFPEAGKAVKPLGDAFIKGVKMLIAPIVFCTVVHGIASMGNLRRLGRLGFRTLLYFEIVSTVALLVGLVVVNLWRPGAGFNIDPTTLDPQIAASYADKAKHLGATDFLLNIIPRTVFEAFVTGDLLQVLLVAILVALALIGLGPQGAPLLAGIEQLSQLFFGVMNLVVKFAPIGAFGAMAFTIGSYGLGALGKLLELMACFYATALFFVLVVLGGIARMAGFSILRLLAYLKDEWLLVLGTSSSETALPGLIRKLERLGCSRSTAGLVIPTGYSFNLDGTNLYMTLAALFLAQATNTPLDWHQQLTLLVVAMLTSKGASGVTGAGFVTLAATLAAVPSVPLASLALIVGIDRFMSECRAITNLIGNGVATLVIARWQGELSADALRTALTPVEVRTAS